MDKKPLNAMAMDKIWKEVKEDEYLEVESSDPIGWDEAAESLSLEEDEDEKD